MSLNNLPTPPTPAKPITITVIGAGQRGQKYASYSKSFPEWMKVVAVAEHHEAKRKNFAKEYQLAPDRIFYDWKDIIALGRISDAVAICTPDKLHAEPAIEFANLKYNILLEKPMAVSIEDCKKIHSAVTENNVIFGVGHVLRYTKYTHGIMSILNSKVLGDIINIQHIEPVGFYHFAHSFVRGNWNNEEDSTFSLMAKSCHDIDLIPYMMGSKVKKISSFGNLKHFKKESKPAEAKNATSCFKCDFESKCPYSAKKIYLDSFVRGNNGWPNSVVQPNGNMDIENLTSALKSGNYGKCVYELNNDVCDHQIVNMEFENGSTASFTMVAFTEQMCNRQTRIFGSRGELVGDGTKLEVFDFSRREKKIFNPMLTATSLHKDLPSSGHFGGDFALARSFLYACATGNQNYILSGIQETFDSHMYVFAAEKARREGTVVNISDFIKSI